MEKAGPTPIVLFGSYAPGPGLVWRLAMPARGDVPKLQVGGRSTPARPSSFGWYAPGPGAIGPRESFSWRRPVMLYATAWIPSMLPGWYAPGPGLLFFCAMPWRRAVPKPNRGEFGSWSPGTYCPGPGTLEVRIVSRWLVPKTTREAFAYLDASGATEVYAPGPGMFLVLVSLSFRPENDHLGAALHVERVVMNWVCCCGGPIWTGRPASLVSEESQSA